MHFQFASRAKMGDEIKRLRNMMVSSFDEASKSREQFHASAQAQQAQQAQQFPTHHERSAVSHRIVLPFWCTIQCVCPLVKPKPSIYIIQER